MTEAESQTVNRAIGRIFGLCMRPGREGDSAEYWRARSIVLDLIGGGLPEDRRPCYVRDRNKGAQGD